MDEYLPPVVTKLKADLSDLITGFVAAKAMVADFGRYADDTITNGMRNTGRNAGLAFADGLRSTAMGRLAEGFDRDVGGVLGKQAARSGAQAGAGMASSMFAAFRQMLMPLLIGWLILMSPVIITAVGAAISAGIGLAFIGIGALALKSQPALVAAATKLKETFVSVFKDAASPLEGPFLRALNILDNLVKTLGPSFKQIFAALAPAVEPIAKGFGDFMTAMMPGLIELAKGAAEVLKAMAGEGGTIGKAFGEMFLSIAKATPDILAFVDEAGPALADLLVFLGLAIEKGAELYNNLSNFGRRLESVGFGKPFGPLLHLLDVAREGLRKLGEWLSTLPDKVAGWLASLPEKLKTLATRAFDEFFYAVGFGAGKVISFFQELPGKLATLASELWAKVKEKWTAGVDFAVETVRTLPGRAMTAVSELPGKIKEWAQGAGKWLYDAGKDMIRGLIAGIMDTTQAAIDAIKRAMGRIVQGANNAIERRSPPRVFVEMGRDSMRGYILGLVEEQGPLAHAWARMGGPARPILGRPGPVPALAAAGGAGGGGGGGEPILVQLLLDGSVLVEKLIAPAQQRKTRTGSTGLS